MEQKNTKGNERDTMNECVYVHNTFKNTAVSLYNITCTYVYRDDHL